MLASSGGGGCGVPGGRPTPRLRAGDGLPGADDRLAEGEDAVGCVDACRWPDDVGRECAGVVVVDVRDRADAAGAVERLETKIRALMVPYVQFQSLRYEVALTGQSCPMEMENWPLQLVYENQDRTRVPMLAPGSPVPDLNSPLVPQLLHRYRMVPL